MPAMIGLSALPRVLIQNTPTHYHMLSKEVNSYVNKGLNRCLCYRKLSKVTGNIPRQWGIEAGYA
jgi:hypothetical protein